MSALGKLAALFVGGDEPVPVEGAGRLAPAPDAGAVPAPSDDEVAAREALATAQAVVADLAERRGSIVGSLDGLRDRRAVLARALSTASADEAGYTQASSRLAAATAAVESLDEQLAAAESDCREAQLRLNDAEAPRLKREREQRVAEVRGAAESAASHFQEVYAEAARTLSVLADRLDALSFLDAGAAAMVGSSLSSAAGDPLRRLEAAGWTARQRSPYVACEFRLFAVTPAAGR